MKPRGSRVLARTTQYTSYVPIHHSEFLVFTSKDTNQSSKGHMKLLTQWNFWLFLII